MSASPRPRGQGASAAARALELAQKLRRVESILSSRYPGRDTYARALVLALATGEHVVLISPPGTAKSAMVRDLARLVNARFFMYLLTRFTEPSELFGPLDLIALKEGRYQRVTRGKLPEAEIAFLDEIFKANSAVLNSLLSILQERVYYDGYTSVSVPLHTAVAASNEVPEEPELQALYDRFAIRVFAGYLESEDRLAAALRARWEGHGDGLQPVMTIEEARELAAFVNRMLSMKVKSLGGEPLWRVYHRNVVPFALRLRREGVDISDRTLIEKLPKLYAAWLLLEGLRGEHLLIAAYEILRYTAKDRDELNIIEEKIRETLGEVAVLREKLERAREALQRSDVFTAKKLLEEVASYDVSRLADKPYLASHAEAAVKAAKRLLQQIEETLRSLSEAAASAEV